MDDAAIIQAVVSERETVAVDDNEDPDDSDSEEGVVECDDSKRSSGRRNYQDIYCISAHYFSAEGLHSP